MLSLFPLYLSYFSTDFNTICTTVYPVHTPYKQGNIQTTCLLLKLTPQCTLHSTVKDSITYNSVLIFSLNFHVNVNYNFTVLWKLLFWMWVMLSFSEFDFKWSVILLHMPTLNWVAKYMLFTLHFHIVFTFEVCDLYTYILPALRITKTNNYYAMPLLN